ncbi:MAG: hypothetical protein WCT04_24660 [Planctomycetota bacterium]
MFNVEEQGGEAKAVGWISMADLFMLCSIVMLSVAVVFAMSLKKTDQLLTTKTADYAVLRSTNSVTIGDLKTDVSHLQSEVSDVRSQASLLDMQLKSTRSQLEATEKQLASSRNLAAQYKAQGEGLSNDLNTLNLKLSAVQSQFDAYRSSTTLSISDLKLDVSRLNKANDDYKSALAILRQRELDLNAKLAETDKLVLDLQAERGKYKVESERLAADIANQRTRFESEIAKLNVLVTKASGDYTKANSDKEQLLIDLNASRMGFANLLKEDEGLKQRLVISDSARKNLEAKLNALEGTIAGLSGEIGILRPQVAKLEVDLNGARLRIIDLEKDVFETINRAKLVVTVTAVDVPQDFTLELLITDPLANECGPFSSVIFNEGDEIGVLQQSVDFRSGRAGVQKAVFYSLRPVLSNSANGGMYVVKAMIRHNSNNETMQLPKSVSVQCNIDLPNAASPDAHKVAMRDITTSGFIKKARRDGPLTASSPYKSMWPWEPVYHFERILCDFRIEGNRIVNLRTYEKLSTETAGPFQPSTQPSRSGQEQRIDSVRQRTGN